MPVCIPEGLKYRDGALHSYFKWIVHYCGINFPGTPTAKNTEIRTNKLSGDAHKKNVNMAGPPDLQREANGLILKRNGQDLGSADLSKMAKILKNFGRALSSANSCKFS